MGVAMMKRHTGTLLYALAVVSWITQSSAFLVTDSSCSGRCNTNLDQAYSCQCNSHCTRFGDCCHDYSSLCSGGGTGTSQGTSGSTSCTTKTVQQVSEELWKNDVNRLASSDLDVNYQVYVPSYSGVDRAYQKLFTRVNEAKLHGETFRTFLALLNNYVPTKGSTETVTSQERQEQEAFLDAILKTSVMKKLQDYLTCKGTITGQADLRSRLLKMWFDLYPRSGSSSVKDTSGFEHLMVGEYKNSSAVNGFHNWLSFYEKEKSGAVNYHGYVYKSNPNIVGASFEWNGHLKTMGSFIIGVSPEFDIALYSLCFLQYPDKSCPISLGGNSLRVQTYSTSGHISTAYVSS